jgi:hypothetical protein
VISLNQFGFFHVFILLVAIADFSLSLVALRRTWDNPNLSNGDRAFWTAILFLVPFGVIAWFGRFGGLKKSVE